MTSHAADSSSQTSLVPLDRIERMVLFVRRQKVMLDRDLAELYGVGNKGP